MYYAAMSAVITAILLIIRLWRFITPQFLALCLG
jgi:hypothetical protein